MAYDYRMEIEETSDYNAEQLEIAGEIFNFITSSVMGEEEVEPAPEHPSDSEFIVISPDDDRWER